MDEHAIAVGSTFVWHECYTRDVEATKAFYTGLLGWTTSEFGIPGMEGTPYTMVHNMGQPVGGIFKMDGPQFEQVPPHWSVYIAVEDVDATVAKAEGIGGSVVVPAMDVPTVGRMALLSDPQGAMFWVYKSAVHG
jgi:predicted enzyme related to lactoylglutathione lyase